MNEIKGANIMGMKNYAKQPLLYIQQPNIGVPKAQMQHDYYTPKQRQENETAEVVPKRKVYSRPIKEYQVIGEEEVSEPEDEIESKQFADMTLEEKVMYFIQRSNKTPAIKCEIKTENKKYRGFVVDFKDNVVFMKIENRANIREILFPEITSIRMLGF